LKIYAQTIAYNEECLIGASLKSIYDYVDEIIVVDGSSFGPSTDKTAEIAVSMGKKVKLFKGTFSQTFRRSDGTSYPVYHEKAQRQACIDKMERSFDNWCIISDADQIYDGEYIQRLLEYIKNADSKTMSFDIYSIAFQRIRDPRRGGPAACNVFRLIPEVEYIKKSAVGIPGVQNWRHAPSPVRIVPEDVFFYHFHDFLPYERKLLKMRCMIERGSRVGAGYGSWEWERFHKDMQLQWLQKEREIHEELEKRGMCLPNRPHLTVEDLAPWIDFFKSKRE